MIVVPDSNIFIAQVVSLDYTEAAERKLTEWLERGTELVVPSLWSYEIVSALRKAMTVGLLTQEQVKQGLDAIFSFNIREVPPSTQLHQSALHWAVQLQQTVAYDAAFLALADSLGADFWTADKRLFNTCQRLQLQWVHSLQELDAVENNES
ncbi:type II toxin-antitoxin system VapC family toxin [Phormidium sp. FACHB-1136]|uniref:type II toxin-antitoxin system VapC family toxin n=1 Tax=Phormidium sp. FACHB-1136 TaxID=2692848 RepID=UPI001685FEAF|nr:type II toxin-antitoxin system VapC family toxin [Phormidium sp. FACHB-1136]MBD2427861.1 type II toxin-antitoxin system VapC family toxin [Phormidium sp. FACHB-1136]